MALITKSTKHSSKKIATIIIHYSTTLNCMMQSRFIFSSYVFLYMPHILAPEYSIEYQERNVSHVWLNTHEEYAFA